MLPDLPKCIGFWNVSRLWPFDLQVTVTRRRRSVEGIGGLTLTGENRSTRRKACLNATFHGESPGNIRLSHGSPTFLWQWATPVILGWFAGRTWKNSSYATANHLNYSVNSVVYTQFTHMEMGRTIQIGGPRVGNPYSKSHGTSADWFL